MYSKFMMILGYRAEAEKCQTGINSAEIAGESENFREEPEFGSHPFDKEVEAVQEHERNCRMCTPHSPELI